MTRSILAGLLAGALWGLVFVLPRLIPAFSSTEVTLGRYSVYGLIAVFACLSSWRSHRAAFTPALLGQALWLGLLGNVLYFTLLVFAVRWAGTGLTGLIIGTIPIWVMLLGRPKHLSFVAIVPGLLCTLAGLWLMHGAVAGQQAGSQFNAGVLCALAALLCWTAYAILNARFLQRQPALSNVVWTNALGLATLLGTLPLFLLSEPGFLQRLNSSQGLAFITISLAMGGGASWLATWLWNRASQTLPTSLTGQLIVSETLFALAYGYAYEQRWPGGMEWLAVALFVLGISLSIRAHR